MQDQLARCLLRGHDGDSLFGDGDLRAFAVYGQDDGLFPYVSDATMQSTDGHHLATLFERLHKVIFGRFFFLSRTDEEKVKDREGDDEKEDLCACFTEYIFDGIKHKDEGIGF